MKPVFFEGRIGPTFDRDLQAAGIVSLSGLSWQPTGVLCGADVSEEDRVRIKAVMAAHDANVQAPEPVPERVTNFQARAVMRQVPMPDGRSLFTAVDTDLREAVTAASALSEFEGERVQADLNWQAWEQANEYERRGAIVGLLAARYGFDEPTTDDLFRRASLVSA